MITTSREKIIVGEVIISEKGNKMFLQLEVRPLHIFQLINWCEHNDVDAEQFLKKFLNKAMVALPQKE